MEEQSLVQFLTDPGHYPEKPSVVTHLQTHISHVFIGDQVVYKIKKPVNFGFLDFTSLRKRLFYCLQEVRLNSRLAPHVYLGVTPICKQGNDYSIGKRKGRPVVEYAVRMKRIPDDCMLSGRIREGRLLEGAMARIAGDLASFHRGLPPYFGRSFGGHWAISINTEENFRQIRPFRGWTIDYACYDRLVSYTREFIARRRKLFGERRGEGFVVEGHGDLHSEHVCLADPPIIFDCIEFNRRFRIGDVLQDMAFLFMDLEFRGRYDLSQDLLDSYFSLYPAALSGELLRFYKVYRAVVRAKVEGLTAQQLGESHAIEESVRRARDYYGLAGCYLEQDGRRFNPVIFAGPSGSGKSVLAAELLPGSLVLRSDAVRKELAGLHPKEHRFSGFGEGIYDAAMTAHTYDTLLERAIEAARKGMRVILDATYSKAEQRCAVYSASCRAGLNPLFIYCMADRDLRARRVAGRQKEGKDISDAHPAMLPEQLDAMEEPLELPSYRVMRLNTDEDLQAMRRRLRRFL